MTRQETLLSKYLHRFYEINSLKGCSFFAIPNLTGVKSTFLGQKLSSNNDLQHNQIFDGGQNFCLF